MSEVNAERRFDPISLTGGLVAAYVANNHVAVADLPRLIGSVHAAISGLVMGEPSAATEKTVEKLDRTQIRRSIARDGLISFIDGRSYKTLKRHLTKHGLTPASYRTHYGLPDDYPMVAPSYSETRSNLAKAIGLGVPGARAAQAGKTETRQRKAA